MTAATSIYRWQGAVERAKHVLHIKTHPLLALPVEQRVRALHSQDSPRCWCCGRWGGNIPPGSTPKSEPETR
ncbi:divalent cation tolerance protein CutA [Sphingomonas sp. SRS2]|uniref:divalent cation tolerance protein CutA n=1 Tax=Sphingomonas sp. SRS2 TaxID=133190 RepID=UPI0006184547|nr:divalent cation tolerance protein CutA [Sphingomonas sp. SRS2]KKC25391.1 hypothetical protein WP12_14185 [Sphingomonas sp. SRS2]